MAVKIVTFAVTALLFLDANALEYEIYNITFCPEVPGERAIIAEVNTRIQDDQQQFIGSDTLLKDFGNDNTIAVEAYRIMEAKEIRLLNYKGKNACSMIVTYGGDLYLNLAKMANVPDPTKCPIAKGTYSVSEYFGISLAALPGDAAKLIPKGKFRVKMVLTDTATNNVDFCVQYFAEVH